jgi:hypothetical protein
MPSMPLSADYASRQPTIKPANRQATTSKQRGHCECHCNIGYPPVRVNSTFGDGIYPMNADEMLTRMYVEN